MSNTLDNVIPQILAQSVEVLREEAVMPRNVDRYYDAEAKQRGSSIDIPLMNDLSVRDVSPGVVHTASGMSNIAPTTKNIALSSWKEVAFVLSDKEIMEIMEGNQSKFVNAAAKAIANQVDGDLIALYKQLHQYVGLDSAAAFADTNDFTDARKVLNESLAPMAGRKMVLSPGHEAAALALNIFQQANTAGTDNAQVNGYLGRKFGFDIMMDQNMPASHVVGSGIASDPSCSGTAGSTTVTVTNDADDSLTLKAGDIFYFGAASTVLYSTTADVTIGNSASGTITLNRPLESTISATTIALSAGVDATHSFGLAWAPGCLALASRPIQDIKMPGAFIETMVDPVTGLVLCLEVSRQYKQTQFSLSTLYGVGVVRPELGVRLVGTVV